MKSKKCIRCKKTRLIKFFSYYDKKNNKRRNICKSCQNIVNSTLPNAVRTRRNVRLKIEFGITVDDYEKLLKLQNGKCAICGTQKSLHKNFCIDHCHNTGKIRGLLCWSCNVGLGHLKDDPMLLSQAINYLDNPTWQA